MELTEIPISLEQNDDTARNSGTTSESSFNNAKEKTNSLKRFFKLSKKIPPALEVSENLNEPNSPNADGQKKTEKIYKKFQLRVGSLRKKNFGKILE